MSINIYDFNDHHKSIIKKAFKAYEKLFNIESKTDVDVTCVDENTIKEINLNTRNIDKVTDVLSFPLNNKLSFPFKKSDYKYNINHETKRVMLGEIIICMERVKEQAIEYGHSAERELAYLTVHGLLHLTGYDHIDNQDKIIMRDKEEEILTLIDLKRD